MRDVAFADYVSSPIAPQAGGELSLLPTYAGPRDASNQVTPQLLFRGPFSGETLGPYTSQLFLKSSPMGALNIEHHYTTLKAGLDYVVDPTTFLQVQNAISTGLSVVPEPSVYVYNGRGLAACTHV